MTDVNTAPREDYHHGDLRRALIAATVALIEEQGPDAFTLREVARRVGVSHAAPYRHFADKRALLAAVAEYGISELGRVTRTAFEGADDPKAGFLGLGRAYIHFAAERPALFGVMFDPTLDDAAASLGAAKDAAFGVLLGAVAAAQQRGALRPADLVDVAITAWSTVHGFAQLVIDRAFERRLAEVRPLEEWADAVTRLGLSGLEA